MEKWWRQKISTATGVSKKYQHSISSTDGSTSCHRFEFPEILSATDSFNESLVIGKGSSGTVYKGTLTDGSRISLVAIKRLGVMSNELRLLKEVERHSKFRHRNLVSLFGYCTYETEMFIVYEYMANGTLEDHLHKLGTPLSWLERLRICIGAGQGLYYLHDETKYANIHGDVRASNIFLDESCAAKISGFGLSKVAPSTQNYFSTSVVGSFGHLDPDYFLTGVLTKKTDVYAFGVLLFEVLCTISSSHGEKKPDLARRARDSIKEGNIENMIDSGIKGQVHPYGLKELARIVEGCLYYQPKERPTMADVVACLKSVLMAQESMNVPQLPGQMIVGGSYSRQNVKLLSEKSHEHIGDHGRMSDSVLETIAGTSFEESHSLEKVLKQKMWLSNEEITPASEANRKFKDRESGDQTESLYEPMNLKYIQRADLLMRKKDLLHLIWLYSVKKEAEVNFVSLVDKFSLLNEYITKSTDSSTNGSYLVEIQILLQYIEEHLDAAAFDMEAFLSEGLVENRSGFWSSIPEVHASAVASATHRAVNCIKDLKVKKLGISGIGAEEIAETLKDLPDLKTGFDMILSVYVKQFGIEKLMNDIEEEIKLWRKRSSKTDNETIVSGQFLNCLLFLHCSDGVIFNWDHPMFNLSKRFGITQIVITYESQYAYKPLDMQIRLMDHLLPWILFSTNADLAAKDKYPSIQQMAKRLIEKCDGHLLAIILLARELRSSIKVSTWKLALQELSSQNQKSSSSLLGVSDVMVRVLRFIWPRMKTLSRRCIIQYASRYKESKFEKYLLINSWINTKLKITYCPFNTIYV